MEQICRKIIVTGATRGLGLALIEIICSMTHNNQIIVLTGRSEKKCQEKAELLISKYPSVNLLHFPLDVTQSSSIIQFKEWVKQNLQGQFDVLVNNAGVYGTNPNNTKEIRENLDVNYYGVVNVTQSLLPYLSHDGKVILVSSGYGKLKYQSQQLQNLLQNIEQNICTNNQEYQQLTLDSLSNLVEQYYHDALNKNLIKQWNNSPPYQLSKCLANTYIRYILTKSLKNNQQCFALCPGWVRTDMGGINAPLTPQEGVQTALFLIYDIPYQVDDKFNGQFFQNKGLSKY